ncbi:MAG: DUF5916 domain-containing protein, partial [Acidobacteriota bacterium]|nr:DUF5916 domain-containing protein [Acidobacteriota bacterium]
MRREISGMRVLVSCVLFVVGVEAGVGGRVALGHSEVGTPRSAIVDVRVFTNVTGVPADDWMGVGIVETVSTSLEGVEGLVVARDSLGNSEKRPVSWIVTGAYQRLRDRLRITARITDAETQVTQQSVILDGALDEFFVLQDQVAARLRQELVARVGRGTTMSAAGATLPEQSIAGAAVGEPLPAITPGPDASSPAPGASGEGLRPGDRFRVQAQRVEQGPLIDGLLNEEVWRLADVIDEFVQQEPVEGEPATERTVVRLLYDAQAIYIGVEAYDSEPSGIIATEMRRDSLRLLDEDNFQVIFDTFHDRRSGYMFVTSPLGARLEQQVAAEGEGGWRGQNTSNINLNWDGVWEVVANRTDSGWTAEIAIPMVTLRFPKVEEQVWGINFMRNIRRKNEQVFWAPVSKEYGLTRVSRAGTMTGVTAVDRGMDLRVTPYILTGGKQNRSGGSLDGTGFGDVGLDVKYGVASGLNLDVTVNTDFAQIEVDEQQVNLTRFPLFFPEKRDFFLENSGMFNVGASSGFSRLADLFFTRRIGLSETGQLVPIIGGARLSGKVDRHNIAAMNITTQDAFGSPGENFFVGRYSRDILSRSQIGGIVINKEAVASDQYNRTFAADTTLAVHPNFVINAFLAKTETPGVSSGDMAAYARATWLSRAWSFYGEYIDLQDNFNAEVGFVPRVGIRTSKFHAEWDPRPKRWNIRMLDPMWNIGYTTDQHNRLLTRRIHNMIGTYFEDGSTFTVWYNDLFEQLDIPFSIRDDVTILPGTYRFGEWNFRYRSNPSLRLYAEAAYRPQTFFGGTRTDVQFKLGLRASSRIAVEALLNRSDVELPVGAFVADLASVRFDWALSPEVTLRTLSQYNSTTSEISNSIRFNWIYRPGSDIFVSYDEMRIDTPGI